MHGVSPRGQRLQKHGGGCTAALDIEKAAPDCGQNSEYLGIVIDKNGRFARTDADGGVYDAVVKTLKRK